MNPFTAEQTPKTPHINFDPATGIFELNGKSVPENSVIYYKPLFDWLDQYVQNPAKNTTLTVQLDYFNTSSAKCIVDLFKKIELIYKSGKGEVVINWMYNEPDEDMLEVGEDYKSIIKVPFNLIVFNK